MDTAGSDRDRAALEQERRWLLGRAAVLGLALAMLLAAGLVFVLVRDRVPTVEPAASAITGGSPAVGNPGGALSTAPGVPPGAGAGGAPGGGAPPAPPAATSGPQILAEGELPPGWPAGLPVPEDVAVLGATQTGEKEWRWVFGTSRNWPLAGGRIIEQLTEAGWEIELMSSASGVTVLARRGAERLSVAIRPGTPDLPAGWGLIEMIHQAEPQPVEPPAPDPDQERAEAEKEA